MDFPIWLSTSAFVAAIGAIFGSLLPILFKVLQEYTHRRASSNLVITLGDGNKVSIEAKSLDSKAVGQLIDALIAAKAKDKAEGNE